MTETAKTEDEIVTKAYIDAKGNEHTPYGIIHTGKEEAKHDTLALDCTLFLFLMMMIGQFCKQISKVTGIPYTSIITVIGVIFGVLSIKI